MTQLATLTPNSTSPKLRITDGMTPAGTTKTKVMALLPTGQVLQTLNADGINAVATLTAAIEPLLINALSSMEITTNSTITV